MRRASLPGPRRPLALLALLAACSSEPGSTDPMDDGGAPPPGEVTGLLVLVAKRGDEQRLAFADPEGRAMTLLLGVGSDDSPAWASDGSTIAFERLMPGGNSDIIIVDAATGQGRPLMNTPQLESQPSFSPDGQRLALTIDIAGAADDSIYLVTTVNASRTEFAAGSQPAWGPTGTIAYVARADANVSTSLPAVFLRELDGSGTRRLSPADDAAYMDPAWSLDGRVAYVRRRIVSASRSEWSLVEQQSSGAGVRTILSDTAAIRHPSWSPDGRHLVVTRVRAGVPALWVVRADASAGWRITPVDAGRAGIYGNANASWRPVR